MSTLQNNRNLTEEEIQTIRDAANAVAKLAYADDAEPGNKYIGLSIKMMMIFEKVNEAPSKLTAK